MRPAHVEQQHFSHAVFSCQTEEKKPLAYT